jgi:hypothetical protein
MTARAIMAFCELGPKTAVMAMARMKKGKE